MNFYRSLKDIIEDKKNLIIFLFIFLALFYLVSRIYFLWQIPLFEDEALFVGWSKKISGNFNMMFEPMKNGISPLFSWITVIFLLFTDNPFLAGRWCSIAAGFVFLILLFFILKDLGLKKELFFLIIAYMFFPIVFWYNRLALLETLMVLFIFLSIYFSWLWTKSNRPLFIAGFLFFQILALLAKPISLITAPAVIVGLLAAKVKISKVLKFLAISLIPLLAVLLIFLPFLNKLFLFLADYVFISRNFSEVLIQFKKNSWLAFHWTFAYYSNIVILFSVLGFLISLLKGDKMERFYCAVFCSYLFLILVSDKIFFPRHTLVFAPFYIIFCAVFLKRIKFFSQKFSILLSIILLISCIYSSVETVLNSDKSSYLAKEDIFQFYEDWTSGKVLPEIADYLENENSDKQIAIFVDSDLYYYGLPLYLKKDTIVNIQKVKNLQPPNNQNYFLIANKIKNKNNDFTSKKLFNLSSRHQVEVFKY